MMMKKLYGLCMALIMALAVGTALPDMCFARLSYVTVESKGTGSSAKAAIYDAITQAIGQVNGMQIASKTTHAIAEASVETHEDDTYFASEAFGQQIQTATKGAIKTYNVLSLDQNADMNNLWFANIEVTLSY